MSSSTSRLCNSNSSPAVRATRRKHQKSKKQKKKKKIATKSLEITIFIYMLYLGRAPIFPNEFSKPIRVFQKLHMAQHPHHKQPHQNELMKRGTFLNTTPKIKNKFGPTLSHLACRFRKSSAWYRLTLRDKLHDALVPNSCPAVRAAQREHQNAHQKSPTNGSKP